MPRQVNDPIRFRGWDVNLYGYVLGDPVNFVDPEGLAAFLAIPLVQWGVGLGVAGAGAAAAQPYVTDWLDDW